LSLVTQMSTVSINGQGQYTAADLLRQNLYAK
jgi:hypothetical protein